MYKYFIDKTKTKQIRQTKKPKTRKQLNIKHHNTHTTHSTHSYNTKNYHSRIYSKLNGGKYIDKGAFGCVITPALPCSSISKQDPDLSKSVSKIFKKSEDDTLTNEIKISKILQQIDPAHIYFVFLSKFCYINKIPNDRTDIVSGEYNETLTKFTNDKYYNSIKLDKSYCEVDLNMKPVNFIIPYAGISLGTIMKYRHYIKDYNEPNSNTRTSLNIKKTMHTMFINNLKIYFKHLLIGLSKLHSHRVVNRDIKQKNIIIQYIQNNNAEMKDTMYVRYIDFGLSMSLTSNLCSDINNITLEGTYSKMPPELFICSVLKKYRDHSQSYQVKKIANYINTNVKKMFTDIAETNILNELDSNVISLHKKIESLFDTNNILFAYFGSDAKKYNGYLQKTDIYALGLTIFETLYIYSKINIKTDTQYKLLYDLLLNMISIEPDKRFNVIQCISHAYFQ